MQKTVVNAWEHNRSKLHIIFLLTYVLRGSPSAFWLAVQSIMEVVVPQLKGECFAPPSAMIDEVALRRVDAGMGVGSPSFFCNFLFMGIFGNVWCEALSSIS